MRRRASARSALTAHSTHAHTRKHKHTHMGTVTSRPGARVFAGDEGGRGVNFFRYSFRIVVAGRNNDIAVIRKSEFSYRLVFHDIVIGGTEYRLHYSFVS